MLPGKHALPPLLGLHGIAGMKKRAESKAFGTVVAYPAQPTGQPAVSPTFCGTVM